MKNRRRKISFLFIVWKRIAIPALALGSLLCLPSCSSGTRDPEQLATSLDQLASSIAEVSDSLNQVPDESLWGRLAVPLREEADALNGRVRDAADQVSEETESVSASLARQVASLLDDGRAFVETADEQAGMMATMVQVGWSGLAPVYGAARDGEGRPVFLVIDVESGTEVALLEGDKFDSPTIVPNGRTGVQVGELYFRFHAASIAYQGSGDAAQLQMVDLAGNVIGTLSATNEIALSDQYAALLEAANTE